MNKFEIATKEKMLFYKATLFLLAKLNIIDDKSISALVRTHAFKQLKRQYLNFVENFEPSKKQRLNCNKVWICWFQGIENAPDIVKKCVDSIKKNINDREIVIITKENYSKYVTLPDYIIDKWEKGIISNAHFSDILRIELLIEHGGLWLDATTYCTGAVPDYIDNSDLFVYNTDYWHNSTLIMGNWLMGAKSHSPILELTQDLLYSYWKKENYVKNYFLMHLFFAMAADKFPDEWSKVPFFTQTDNHILYFELFNQYKEKRMNDICNLTPFHKLTYKKAVPDDYTGTFYDYIMNSLINGR